MRSKPRLFFFSQHTFLYIYKIFYKNIGAEILRNLKARQFFWGGEGGREALGTKMILRVF